jgi:hypothetical protein
MTLSSCRSRPPSSSSTGREEPVDHRHIYDSGTALVHSTDRRQRLGVVADSRRVCAVEVGEDGEHPAVALFASVMSSLVKCGARGLRRCVRCDQPAGDAGVREPLGHEWPGLTEAGKGQRSAGRRRALAVAGRCHDFSGWSAASHGIAEDTQCVIASAWSFRWRCRGGWAKVL